MRLKLEKVILNNFLSYDHAEIDLKDRGYCLVSGINKCLKDNAMSNGSGKSSFTSAICWALTGQTIQGIKTNIKNIYADKDADCSVTLVFTVDGSSYEITRYKDGKAGSDLKIKLNGNDISGKGIKESEAILAQYLPDLTPELISSVIILGQGLPYKFTSNKPSGRKEVLEQLSKSDFMIQDLKQRIATRINYLQQEQRQYEDSILAATSKKDLLSKQLEEANSQLILLEQPKDYDSKILSVENDLNNLDTQMIEKKKLLDKALAEMTEVNDKLTELLDSKNKLLNEDAEEFNKVKSNYFAKKASFDGDIRMLNSEITKLKNITDICPTCGQKIPGAVKPDTSEKEKLLDETKSSLDKLLESYSKNEKEHNDYVAEVEEKYKNSIKETKFRLGEIKIEIADHRLTIGLLESDITKAKSKLTELTVEKTGYETKLKQLKDTIVSSQKDIDKLFLEIENDGKKKATITNHLNVVNQMNTIIKRDFRGFLLSNVISFIDTKAKEYSKDIFGTTDLDFILDGNDINISYCKKPFENLSGGEKQKVDLIIQFAIRDMMSQYLDFRSNILVLDEITDNLDATGCTNVLNLISKKLNDIESVFIISHHADELSIPYDSQIVVVKNEQGVSSIQ